MSDLDEPTGAPIGTYAVVTSNAPDLALKSGRRVVCFLF
jgi:hypothetical protein